MKKVSGILLLLLFALLVSMPVVAEPYVVSNGIALDSDNIETKIGMQEEVVDFSLVNETIANRGEPPSRRLGFFYINVFKSDFIEADYIICFHYLQAKVIKGSIAGGVLAFTGYCKS